MAAPVASHTSTFGNSIGHKPPVPLKGDLRLDIHCHSLLASHTPTSLILLAVSKFDLLIFVGAKKFTRQVNDFSVTPL